MKTTFVEKTISSVVTFPAFRKYKSNDSVKTWDGIIVMFLERDTYIVLHNPNPNNKTLSFGYKQEYACIESPFWVPVSGTLTIEMP